MAATLATFIETLAESLVRGFATVGSEADSYTAQFKCHDDDDYAMFFTEGFMENLPDHIYETFFADETIEIEYVNIDRRDETVSFDLVGAGRRLELDFEF